jgi:hypothetical protein
MASLFDDQDGTKRQSYEAISGAPDNALIELRVAHKTDDEQVEPLLPDEPDHRLGKSSPI